MENSLDKRQFSVTASDYEILEEIGQGVSATVYRARCIPFDEIVAIKSLDLEKCNSNLDEIRKEAATMSMISHPSVVRAHCSFVVDQHLWVVMPYLSGGSCLHIMKAAFPDGFEEPVIATILKETLKALEYLHRHGHIHRDVKAGNILVDSSGVVKLADFGVSACMFDTGDRQRSRQTFVGTPCWMAPEVMEQLHGYDFKADIWSFGITALELAHGHAPFSKYPPMKVLLMTLQNAPPGLDQERDKGRFSKAFKEMIAMCLVKDPAKRPAAEKLLKHAFFKHAKSPDYVAKLLLGLPPLGERVKTLKVKDQARLAQKKVPMEEQEAKSQNEYKRGVSSWNFNVEDLKAQAALLEDEDDDGSKGRSRSASDHDQELPSQSQAPSPATTPPLQSGRGDAAVEGNGGGPVRPKGTPVPQPSQKVGNGPKYGTMPVARKEPKHIGRFDVFEDDYGDSPDFRSGEHYIQRHVERQRPLSGPLDPQRAISGARTSQSDEATNTGMRPGHERVQSQSDRFVGGGSELRHTVSAKSFSGALPSAGCAEDRPKGVPFVQKKGRFSVTSEDVDLEEDAPSARVIGTSRAAVSVSKSASSADVTVERRISGGPASASMPSISTHAHATVPVTALTPHLNQILNYMSATQDTILMLMNSISPSDMCSARTGSKSNLLSRAGSLSHSESGNESFSADREQQLMHQVAELQSKLSIVMEEMQHLKLRNVQLERQLNAIYNEEEERRIQQEESRKEGGS